MGNSNSNQTFEKTNGFDNNPFISKSDVTDINMETSDKPKMYSYISNKNNVITKFNKYLNDNFKKYNNIKFFQNDMNDLILKYTHYKVQFTAGDSQIFDQIINSKKSNDNNVITIFDLKSELYKLVRNYKPAVNSFIGGKYKKGKSRKK